MRHHTQGKTNSESTVGERLRAERRRINEEGGPEANSGTAVGQRLVKLGIPSSRVVALTKSAVLSGESRSERLGITRSGILELVGVTRVGGDERAEGRGVGRRSTTERTVKERHKR